MIYYYILKHFLQTRFLLKNLKEITTSLWAATGIVNPRCRGSCGEAGLVLASPVRGAKGSLSLLTSKSEDGSPRMPAGQREHAGLGVGWNVAARAAGQLHPPQKTWHSLREGSCWGDAPVAPVVHS